MVRNKRKAKPGNPGLAIGYIRASKEDQALTPRAQAHALDAWAERMGVTLVAVFFDLGLSGSLGLAADGFPELEKRPGLAEALQALRVLHAGSLVVAKRDRLARDVTLAGLLGRMAGHAGARIISAAGEGTELADSEDGDDMRLLYDMFAQRERRLIRSRTKAALAVKKARGERIGQVPYGWRLAADGVTLEVDPLELATLEHIKAERARGVSLRGIVADLNEAGAFARGSRWHLTTIARVLRKP